MTSPKSGGNRLQQASSHRASVGQIRQGDRSGTNAYRNTDVMLPNPVSNPPVDRMRQLDYEGYAQALGLAPNTEQHFWQLLKGDAGAGRSMYRLIETYQNLGAVGARTAETPYSKAVEIMTDRSRDQRPKYWQVSLFNVGRVFAANAPTPPLSLGEIRRFAPGIPAGTPSVSGTTQYGVPQYGTAQFRVLVHDESGGRYYDVDVVGTRSFDFYAWGVTVFALIKEDGYVIDRQREDNPPLGPGLLDQAVIGARIIPIITNETQPLDGRTVTLRTPAGVFDSVLPIPPGARRVQVYFDGAPPPAAVARFVTIDPLDPAFGVIGTQGVIDFPVGNKSDIELVPNANAISFESTDPNEPARNWTAVFEVTP